MCIDGVRFEQVKSDFEIPHHGLNWVGQRLKTWSESLDNTAEWNRCSVLLGLFQWLPDQSQFV